jgi:diaminobutyrate-2-oxoglutarate transaminase
MTSGALSLTSDNARREPFLPLVPEAHFVPYPYCYRCPFTAEPARCGLLCADFLDHVLEDPHSGVATPAAVIVEAIQGEGGTIVPPDGFIPRIRQICDRHDIVMIADEVQTGFCRTGKMFSFEHTETLPDVVTMSKGLGGIGLPLSGIAYKEKLNTWPAGAHVGTFRGNVTAYAAGAAALSFMVGNNLADHALKLGEVMLGSLKELEKTSAIVGEARGKGLMLGVELVKDKGTKFPAPDLAKSVRAGCHRRGLLIEIGGHYDNVARFLPPLVITRELAMKGLEIFADSLKETESAL